MIASHSQPYAPGEQVYFSTYARPEILLTGIIERVRDALDLGRSDVRVLFYCIRETRTQEPYLVTAALVYGHVYS
ncbi:MAG: hypothetical protein ACXWQ5_00945 [Ktedonobacterales bacterium]